MIPCKTITNIKVSLLILFLIFTSSNLYSQALDGRSIFNSKCASCHNVFKVTTGPSLGGFQERAGGKWADMAELTAWIRNPAAYSRDDAYTTALIAEYKTIMQAFPEITDEEVQAITDHINTTYAKGEGGGTTGGTTTGEEDEKSSNRNAIFFGIISLIMAIIALILMQVNSNLKKLSDDAEGVVRPEPVPFYRNKVYIAMASIVFFIVGGFFVAKGAIGLGRHKDYQPEQPIYYSHKVHAGINQISCLYCHGNAMESKHAAIPSTNVCMNCHKAISEYTGPTLYDENGEEINGTREIQKLYRYANFDPKNPNAWDPSMADSIPWIKIHNLPDHVYFNHSQHVKVGNVQCQTCHGEITDMHEVYQFTDLSMGWCINCHRETKVNFNYEGKDGGNKFYSMYEKFHNDIKSGKMDSITVKDIGGLECQKCHY